MTVSGALAGTSDVLKPSDETLTILDDEAPDTTDQAPPADQTVTVTVTNVDEEGAVALDSTQPVADTALTATLSDPDGGVTGVTWTWHKSADGQSGWSAIAGAASASYTPVSGDAGQYLRATASYTDGHGAGKSARAVSANAVSAATVTNNAPAFTSGNDALSVPENTTAAGTVAAEDADTDDDIESYAITGGADEAKFSIDSGTGALTFRTAPDFEAPADVASTSPANAAQNNEYVVEVTATGGTGGRALTAAQTVTVTVTNVDEEGAVALDSTQPVADTALTATLSDPDGGVTGVTWTWHKSADGQSGWSAIAGAASASYTPVSGDAGQYLRATASYTDGHGAGKSARAVSANAVSAATVTNNAPAFTSGNDALSVPENTTAAGTVAAEDADTDDDIESYAITGGADEAKFSIDSGTGALTFRTAPDFEAPADVASTSPANAAQNNEYVVEVTATGGTGGRALTAAQTVTVTVTNVDEEGAVALDSTQPVADTALTATLSDPDGGVTGVTWTWHKSADGQSGWSAIAGAASASYTPVSGEAGQYLRATASYTDGHGAGKSARAVSANAVSAATVTNNAPKAWLARFGRTVTGQVLDAVEARLTAPRAAGGQATLAGQALPSWDADGGTGTAVAKAAANPGSGAGAGPGSGAGAGDNAPDRAFGMDAGQRDAAEALRTWMAHAGDGGNGADSGVDSGVYGEDGRPGLRSRALTGRDFLTGTSFAWTAKAGDGTAGGFASLWGRGAIARFDGREGDLTLDGEVTTGLVGADWASERWTAGLALGHSSGTGGYRGASAGKVEATLTGLYPYAGAALSERLSVWAAAGYGAGELTLRPAGTDGNEDPAAMTADLLLTMGAAGMRSEVLTPEGGNGLTLALKGDARFTRTSSEAATDAKGGKLAASDADVWLLRTGLEGSRRLALGDGGDGATLTPSFEVGLRLDGGDAETGFGADLGGGLAFADPGNGLSLDLKARGLVVHEASGFREWGASATLSFDPRPSTDRGLALSLRQSWGASPAGGMDGLLGRGDPGGARGQRRRRRALRGVEPSGGRDRLRHRRLRRRFHRHAEPGLRALGQCAGLPARLAADLGSARRPRLRGQSRRHPQGERERRRAGARGRRPADGAMVNVRLTRLPQLGTSFG